MKKSRHRQPELLFSVFALLSALALPCSARREDSRIGFIGLSTSTWAVTKVGDAYRVSEINRIEAPLIENEILLSHADARVIEQCKMKIECPDLELIGSKTGAPTKMSGRGPAGVYVRQISPGLMAFHLEGNAKRAEFIDARGRVHSTPGASTNAIDARGSTIYSAYCELGENRCEIRAQSLGQTYQFTVAQVPYHVDDLIVREGKLILLGRTIKEKSGLIAAIFSAAGHPPSKHDWVLLELNREGKLTLHPLLKETAGGVATFVDKWVPQHVE